MTEFKSSGMPGKSIGRRKIAIIGGGISGLAAAHRVRELRPGAELILFEASSRVGGVLETIERDGYLVERAADNFLTSRPAGVALCRRLGLDAELLSTEEAGRRAMVVRDGRLLPIPAGFYLMSPRQLWPVLRSPILSLRSKIRLLAEPLVPPRTLLALGDDENNSEAVADESVASFVRRRLGNEVFQRLVQPLVAGIYTADASKLSMQATMPEFLAYERRFGSLLRATLKGWRSFGHESEIQNPDSETASGARYGLFVAPKRGIGSLVNALASRLPQNAIQLNSPIFGLRAQGDGRWLLECNSHAARAPFDAVIIAVPAYAAAKLLCHVDQKLASGLADIEYAGIIVASCAFRRDQIAHSLDSFGFVVPRVEARRIVAASFASNKFAGRAPDGHILIRTFIGGSLQPELLATTDNDVRRLVIDELADLLKISGLPQWIDIARWPASMPQYHVGHIALVERIEKLAQHRPSLALAGNAYRGVGIPQCIASGESAAEWVCTHLAQASN
jgi:oxygen-dependent protoporphyrinogen oxidase